MRTLITGASGFAGSHLVDECLALGWEVHGTAAPHHASLYAPAGLRLHEIDLRRPGGITPLVAAVQPDRVFHLAAHADVGRGWDDPVTTLVENLVMTQHVLGAVREACPAARVLVVSSSQVYGLVDPARMPVVEAEPLQPVDPYGVSKGATELLAQQHALAFDMHVVRARPFNHVGPRQRRGFVLADFAAGIVAIERGEAEPVLRVGNIATSRDFTDVRDVVRAYRFILETGRSGEVYNVCSGSSVAIADLLQALVAAAAVPVQIEIDPGRQRPVDRPAIVGSYAVLREATGWMPRIPIAQTVRDTLAYWREAL
jgi:GDP-4-dehydro-6-deoxy-D-mannose reductase